MGRTPVRRLLTGRCLNKNSSLGTLRAKSRSHTLRDASYKATPHPAAARALQ